MNLWKVRLYKDDNLHDVFGIKYEGVSKSLCTNAIRF